MDLKGDPGEKGAQSSALAPQAHPPNLFRHAGHGDGDLMSTTLAAYEGPGMENNSNVFGGDVKLSKGIFTSARARALWVGIAATLAISAIVFLLRQCSAGLRTPQGNVTRRLAKAPPKSYRPECWPAEDTETAEEIMTRTKQWLLSDQLKDTTFKTSKFVVYLVVDQQCTEPDPALAAAIGGLKDEVAARLPLVEAGSPIELEQTITHSQTLKRLSVWIQIRLAEEREIHIDTSAVHEWATNFLVNTTEKKAVLLMGTRLFKLKYSGKVSFHTATATGWTYTVVTSPGAPPGKDKGDDRAPKVADQLNRRWFRVEDEILKSARRAEKSALEVSATFEGKHGTLRLKMRSATPDPWKHPSGERMTDSAFGSLFFAPADYHGYEAVPAIVAIIRAV
ncbi:uncharacterized protein EMH_0027820 [Eimeria mitis]|uniref:Uncharacterized protein n=1 Tax=Eimeria mitis TaxID=44415 RepID=U6JTV7_9EIME|nr:uncharacterized protein EMH_0027820 [Eimeria mitis]CDJ26953.1 hypothetical protein, conserved [Eimeria mitis]